MSGQSLGLIETVGLATAIKAADAALKAANVTLAGYEFTKGGGLVTLKMQGEVGAVKAAIAAGVAAVNETGQLYSHLIIARSAEGLESLIQSAETVPAVEDIEQPEATDEEPAIVVVNLTEPMITTQKQPKQPQNKTKPSRPSGHKKSKK